MNSLKPAFRLALLSTLLLTVLAPVCGRHGGASGRILADVPERVDPKARYLFYLHGLIVENEGVRPTSPRFGVYEYGEILEEFKSRGFVVIGEARPKGTDPLEYGAKVAAQVRTLLGAGVPPGHVTVAGASRGGAIAMVASTLLKNRRVRFAVMASCGDFEVYKKFKVDLWGEVLSVYDFKDDVAGTCADFFKRSGGISRRKEVVVRLGLGHGILYRPLKEWVEPVSAWASGEGR